MAHEGEPLPAGFGLPHLGRSIAARRSPEESASGDQETKLTGPVCPLRMARSPPVEASDILAVASAPPVAKKRPSGDHATGIDRADMPA